MFKCNTRCCENYDLSIQQVQECITRCNGPSERADQYLQTEMQNFQVGFGYLTAFLYVEIHLYSANYNKRLYSKILWCRFPTYTWACRFAATYLYYTY